jgi:thiamine kinase-like enzyme
MSETPRTDNRRTEDSLIAVIATRLETLHNDLVDLKKSHAKMADALIKLALVEERQATFLAAQERTFKAIERIEDRLVMLEKDAPKNALATNWVTVAVGAAAASALAFVASKVGLK